MYKAPSRKKTKHKIVKPNLIPILDAVFIFIFFLLLSANFQQIFEINSDVPIISDSQPPKAKKPPLALTLKIRRDRLDLYSGVPAKFRKSFSKINKKNYDLVNLREYLIDLKKQYKKENSIIFEPIVDLEYHQIVKIMDSVRALKKTEPAIFIRDKNDGDVRVKELFDKIIFGNIQS